MVRSATREVTTRDDEVAEGVYRFGSRRVNWYVVDADDGVTVVDAGVPGHFGQLVEGLEGLGHGLDDVEALVLTHGHPDHVGFAERLRSSADVSVYVHEADAALSRGEGQGAPVLPMALNLWRPAVVGLLVELARGGGTSIQPVRAVETFQDGATLPVPGEPSVFHVPGHSPGSCALYLPRRDVLLCGDALATLDIRTGRRGDPMLMSLFNSDASHAADSLGRLEGLGEVTLLPGHGDRCRGEMSEAVRLARSGR